MKDVPRSDINDESSSDLSRFRQLMFWSVSCAVIRAADGKARCVHRLTGLQSQLPSGIEQLLGAAGCDRRSVRLSRKPARRVKPATGRRGLRSWARDAILKRLGDRIADAPGSDSRSTEQRCARLDEKSRAPVLVSRMVQERGSPRVALRCRAAAPPAGSVLPPQPGFYLSDAFDRIARRLGLSRQSPRRIVAAVWGRGPDRH
jgi:hypothetical protein